MHSDVPFAVWSRERQRRIEDVLARALSDDAMPAPARLGEAMRYAVLGSGKRVRPLLAYAAGEAAAVDPDDVDCCAAAVELIHAYSLIHDDLPCMDDDAMRRGRPTVHKVFGSKTAILAGVAMIPVAARVVRAAMLQMELRQACVETLLATLMEAGGPAGMIGGQLRDLGGEGLSLSLYDREAIHSAKTGALIVASVRMGALAAGAERAQVEALERYGQAVGLA